MSKSNQSDLPLPAQPPPPYEEVESGRTGSGTGPVDSGDNENTPLLGRIDPFPYNRNRIWRFLKVMLIGVIFVIILGTAVEIIGGKGDEVWKARVGVIGERIFYAFFFAYVWVLMRRSLEEGRREV
jgi:hypothetical protein